MRIVKLIYKWVILSIIIQVLILGYFNFIFLKEKTTIEVTSYDTTGTNDVVQVNIPNTATQIKSSYNSSYIGCLVDGKLKIIDIQSNKEIKLISDEEGTLDYFRWLPDRNMVIYSVNVKDNSGCKVKLGTYDFDSGLEKKNQEIKYLPLKSEVSSIELSPLTNILYVKIKTSSESAEVYKFDIMDNMSFIMNTGAGTYIKETNFSDSLIYQNENNVIRIRNGKTRTSKLLKLKGKLVLLAVDSEDKVYIGKLDDNNEVSNLFVGSPNDGLSYSYDEVTLNKPILQENLVVTSNGKIYEINKSTHLVQGIKNSFKAYYTGDLVEINDTKLITNDKGILKLTPVT